jgi:hypothetical protein
MPTGVRWEISLYHILTLHLQKRAKLGLNAREELLGEECNDSEDQVSKLLINTFVCCKDKYW